LANSFSLLKTPTKLNMVVMGQGVGVKSPPDNIYFLKWTKVYIEHFFEVSVSIDSITYLEGRAILT